MTGGAPVPPKQQRSRKTLDRLVGVAEDLLKQRRFEEISVAELTRQAGSSVGAFYARFPEKDSLLDFLDARGEEEALRRWGDYFDPEKWSGASAREVIRRFVTLSVAAHRGKKGILRTLSLRLRSQPTPEMLARTRRMNRVVVAGLTKLLEARSSELRHPNVKRAIAFGLVMVVTTIRELVVFEDLELYRKKLSDKELIEELVRAFSAYVGLPAAGTRRRKR